MECGKSGCWGRPLAEYAIPQRTKALTVLFQNPDLQFCMDTLRKELFFCLENLSVSPEEMEARVEKFARLYGGGGTAGQKALHPVRGERSRRRPSAVFCFWSPGMILDEPFANLDPESAAGLLELLRRYRREQGATVAVIDHKLDRWLDFADEIMVLGSGGKTLARGIHPENLGEYRRLFQEEGLFFPGSPRLSRPGAVWRGCVGASGCCLRLPGPDACPGAFSFFPAEEASPLFWGPPAPGRPACFP